LDSEEYPSALLLCDQILLTLPSDDSIKICKAVCLVHLGQYKQAEQLFTQNN
jgi:thioredoxin-like negative regulator of GroEL